MSAPGTPALLVVDESGVSVRLDLDVLDWRFQELERAGYPAEVSIELSGMADVDLHVACDLLRNGATLKEALRILL